MGHNLTRPATLRQLVWLCGLLPGLALGQATGLEQKDWLLGQIRLGEAIYRDDLINDALARLELIAPDDPDTLLQAGRQAIRQHELEKAGTLRDRLHRQAPGSPADRQLDSLLNSTRGEAQKSLQEARLFAVAGRNAEALAIYNRLFGGEPPSLELAVEYWRLRSGLSPKDKTAAIARLEGLDRQYPGNAGLRQLLANLLFSVDRNADALKVLGQLASNPAASNAAAQREFDYLEKQPTGAASVAAWQGFLQRFPDSSLATEARKILGKQQALVSDPYWQSGQKGLALLETGQNAGAEAALRRALQKYADDATLNGSLGLALLRLGRREEALAQFQRAEKLEQDTDYISKWHDLIASTRYWEELADADRALEAGNLARASALYQKARQQNAKDAFAVIGLARVAEAGGDSTQAEVLYMKARQLDPQNGSVVRGLVRLYQAQSPDKALAYMDVLPPAQQEALADIRRSLLLARYNAQADAALQRQDWPAAVQALLKVRELDPDNPWVTYRLASSLHAQGKTREADAAFQTLLQRPGLGQNPAARYAHGLYLASDDRNEDALKTLEQIPRASWTTDMQALGKRVERSLLLARIDRLRKSGREPEAIHLLEDYMAKNGRTADDLLMLADWAQQRNDHVQALDYFAEVLDSSPDNPDARLGQIESWLALGKPEKAHEALLQRPPVFPATEINALRRLANSWIAAGEPERGRSQLEQLSQRQTRPDPLLQTDTARAFAPVNPQKALQFYTRAMRDAGLITPVQAEQGDKNAITRATRPQADDDWLLKRIRGDVEALYQKQNTTITVMQDHGWRQDKATPGISKQDFNSTIVHAETPVGEGRGFIRAEHVDLSVGRLKEDANGVIQEDFGGCSAGNSAKIAGKCGGRSQSNSGEVVAAGWNNDQVAVDLGATQGFDVNNVVGGVTVEGDLGEVGWSATASRRLMTNSLLSYAGTTDPVTGKHWGGVTTNGFILGLSWDQGGDYGLWASAGHHWLFGKGVASNTRSSMMGGVYYRLIEEVNQRLRVGFNTLYWQYQKDLGGYTLGQGGYYSPQRYLSFGIPVSYAWRNADWSVGLEGSLSVSSSKTDSSRLYPRSADRQKLAEQYDADPDSLNARSSGSSSQSLGYRVQGTVERRLSDHFVLGTGFNWQYSKQYSPSRAILYLRYSIEPWEGNLPLGPEPLIPYGDFR